MWIQIDFCYLKSLFEPRILKLYFFLNYYELLWTIAHKIKFKHISLLNTCFEYDMNLTNHVYCLIYKSFLQLLSYNILIPMISITHKMTIICQNISHLFNKNHNKIITHFSFLRDILHLRMESTLVVVITIIFLKWHKLYHFHNKNCYRNHMYVISFILILEVSIIWGFWPYQIMIIIIIAK